MTDLANMKIVAFDIILHNNFISIINALSSNDLGLLYIKDNSNSMMFSRLEENEKNNLLLLISDMCKVRI